MGKPHKVICFKHNSTKRIIFQSVRECCHHFKCSETTIRSRIGDGRAFVFKDELYYFDYLI